MHRTIYPIHFTLERQSLFNRARSHHLHQIMRDLIAVQAQYESAAALGLNTRLRGLLHQHILNSLYLDRSLLKMWALRGV